jgi:hypothetical protein
MDIRILESLTTCALYPYLKGKESKGVVHDGDALATGAEFPDSVAVTVLDLPYEGQAFFAMGFNLAIECAALIATDPMRVPDLSAAIRQAKSDIPDATLSAVEAMAQAFLTAPLRDEVIADAKAGVERERAAR